jgi:endonuclease IV
MSQFQHTGWTAPQSHLTDSKTGLNSRLTRHENIGKGTRLRTVPLPGE